MTKPSCGLWFSQTHAALRGQFLLFTFWGSYLFLLTSLFPLFSPSSPSAKLPLIERKQRAVPSLSGNRHGLCALSSLPSPASAHKQRAHIHLSCVIVTLGRPSTPGYSGFVTGFPPSCPSPLFPQLILATFQTPTLKLSPNASLVHKHRSI